MYWNITHGMYGECIMEPPSQDKQGDGKFAPLYTLTLPYYILLIKNACTYMPCPWACSMLQDKSVR